MRKNLILFVCTGNQCRSPMAEYLLRQRLGSESKWQVASAGMEAPTGMQASGSAILALRERDIDAGSHRTRPVTGAMVDEATVIVAMAAMHRDDILRRFPGAAGKVFLFTSLGTAPKPGDVADPAGMSLETYRNIRNAIEAELPNVILFLHEYSRRPSGGSGRGRGRRS